MHTANPLKILSSLPPSDIMKATEMFDEFWRAEETYQEWTGYGVVMQLFMTALVMVYMSMTKQKTIEWEIPEVVVEE